MLLSPYVILFILFFIFPILYAFYMSLYLERGGNRTFVGLQNYMQVFSDSGYWEGFARIAVYAFFYVIILLVVSLVLALLLDSCFVKLRSFFRLAYFLPYAVPSVIAAIMWGFLYSPELNSLLSFFNVFTGGKPLELLSTSNILYGIMNIAIWEWAGYNVTILFANLTSISPELYEAAKIDGCNEFQTAAYIKVPLLRSTLSMITLLTIIGALQLFNEPFLLSQMTSISATYTPNMYIYRMAFSYGNIPYSAALSIVLTLITVLVSILFLYLTSEPTPKSSRGSKKGRNVK